MEEQKEVSNKRSKLLAIIVILLVFLSEGFLIFQLNVAHKELVDLSVDAFLLQDRVERLESVIKGLVAENGKVQRKFLIGEKMLEVKDKAIEELKERLNISESDFLKIKNSIKEIYTVCKSRGILSFNGEEFLCTDRDGLKSIIKSVIESAKPVDVHPSIEASIETIDNSNKS